MDAAELSTENPQNADKQMVLARSSERWQDEWQMGRPVHRDPATPRSISRRITNSMDIFGQVSRT